ncbi:DUF3316 domain-containing protein [Vibrio sp. SCSIO 43137]|uniref:DUF3316 domain-containing protein n=1 Tax=Vibrio sp. SCSIO 43137 TaxID=3021011 RepID=UPI00230801B9|nr:DUF3316 domain-containing protein [Vibrio sp. SCSIO 43137]WCE29330.1 DUF3316 domain-containing protein [Vibrio sp. SCSIO 43137]
MKKLMTVAAGLLLTTSAFASDVTLHRDAKVFSAEYQTKADALNAGFDISDNFASMNQSDLSKALPLFSNDSVSDIVVDQTEVKIEEFARVRGEVKYRAVVDVDYHFNTVEND